MNSLAIEILLDEAQQLILVVPASKIPRDITLYEYIQQLRRQFPGCRVTTKEVKSPFDLG